MAPFNGIDYAVMTILGISSLAGLLRGLLKEIIALMSWTAACIVAARFSSKLAAVFSVGKPGVLALMGSFVTLFIVTLIIGAVVNFIVSRAAEAGGISFINRFLGAAFGFLRGCIIVVVIM